MLEQPASKPQAAISATGVLIRKFPQSLVTGVPATQRFRRAPRPLFVRGWL
jgi:hypothetical protein